MERKLTLPTGKIKEFIDKAKLVPSDKSDLNPIFKYIKLEIEWGICTMTKSNERGFVQSYFETIEEECDPFIIDEKILGVFCDSTKAETVQVSIKDLNVRMTDGYFTQDSVPIWEEISTFPALPELKKDYNRINKDVIDAISCAKNFVSKDDLRPTFCYLYVKDSVMYCSNANIIFVKTFDKVIPDLAININESMALSSFPYVDYCVSDNFNIYKHNNTIYGFRHGEGANGFDYKQFLKVSNRTNYVKIKVEDFLNFCSFISKFPEGGSAISNFSAEDDSARIFYHDSDLKRKNEIRVPVVLHGEKFDFQFIPSLYALLLSSLQFDHIFIGNCNVQMIETWSSDDESYSGFISKYVKPPGA